ncbi:Glutathione S-transferase-like [Rhodopseudomonas palustris HaA2]|uniref:Glutathione S-transferase-like n=1 Tax=Rhodopseudomonas palustris (strain HaA2) TaxID=316058 RepID=Q2IS59_RHOP2|nr:glutathione S-transferase N-terminal domain-containing protein [Rhodopseudomonas palustris]ABD08951.1 Glutathione S-transferase-like [Rhodopseudomonas palustris HaA2]
MDLYFSPLACSMATRIALYEAGGSAVFHEIDSATKTVLADGSDFRKLNPLGLVPVLRTETGVVLTENAAILQYIADRYPSSPIGAGSGIERAKLQQWLNFIATELHRGLFALLLKAPPDVKAFAVEVGVSRLDYLNDHLQGRDYLLDRFSVADAYLATVLNWSRATPQIDLAKWPAIKAYAEFLHQRPSVARALSEELPLFQAEMARHKKAA